MAVDSVLFDRAAAGECLPAVRLYRWNRRAVTVGKLQDIAEVRRTYPDELLVRRPTGGKAVVHGDDLTVTVVAPDTLLTSGLPRRGVLASYVAIMDAVALALADAGAITAPGEDRARRRGLVDCFARAARCDLVDAASGAKIVGSAQARKSGIVLQQMSFRPIASIDIYSSSFADLLRQSIARRLNVSSWMPDALDSTETKLAADRAIAWDAMGQE